jgi:hypothetical protein
MRSWREIAQTLTRPRGFSADGRVLGLGLATALEAQRRKDESVTGVEEYLRQNVSKDEGSTAVR